MGEGEFDSRRDTVNINAYRLPISLSQSRIRLSIYQPTPLRANKNADRLPINLYRYAQIYKRRIKKGPPQKIALVTPKQRSPERR